MGYLNIKVITNDTLKYGKDYDVDTITKEMIKIKGVKSAEYIEADPIKDLDDFWGCNV